jgi:hypothetical protein
MQNYKFILNWVIIPVPIEGFILIEQLIGGKLTDIINVAYEGMKYVGS